MAIPKHIDARNKLRLARFRPSKRGRALQFLMECATAGLDVVVLEVERDDATQAGHWAKGRTLPGKVVTNARYAHQTAHGRRGPAHDAGASAWDFAKWLSSGKADWSDEEFFRKCGAIGESLGFVWGGRFGETAPGRGDGWDAGHLEAADWKSYPLLTKDGAA